MATVYTFVVDIDFVRGANHDHTYVKRLKAGWTGYMRDVGGAYGLTAEVKLKVDGQDITGKIQGLAPKVCLRIGVERRFPYPIEIVDQDAIRPADPPFPSNDNHPVFLKALRAIWQSIRSNQTTIENSLPSLSGGAQRILFGQSAATYADDLYRCMLTGVRDVLDGGCPTWDQLMSLSRVTNNWPLNKIGIYTILYKMPREEDFYTGRYQCATYIGKSNNFPRRDGEHARNPGGSMSNHYRVASKARDERRMIPLLFISGQVPDHFIHIAEFTFLCLFDAWYPDLFQRTNAQLFGSYSAEIEAAAVISSIVRPALEATGWVLPRMVGLNWQTPIFTGALEGQRFVCWWEDAGPSGPNSRGLSMWKYRTRRGLVASNKYIGLFLGQGQHINIPQEVTDAAKFVGRETVHLIAEVAMDSKEGNYVTHPFRFVRFPPGIGVNSEIENLRSLALKIQWLDNGVWKMAYLTRAKLWHGASGDNQAAMSIYASAMAVWMDIRKISYINPPSWLQVRRPAEVQQLSFDHLGQMLVARSVQAQQPRSWPANNTMDENRLRLRTMFANHPDVYIGVKPPTRMPKNRKSCDICYTQSSTTPCRGGPCSFETDRPTCGCCVELNRPCTFTNADMQTFQQHFGRYEELGIAVNIHRRGFGVSAIQTITAPFDPQLEDEHHEDSDPV